MATTTAATRAAVPTTLPLELGGISDERREQLELRRQREMTRQQESRAGAAAGNFRWSPIAMIPAHLCVLVFLVFLLEKLEGAIDWPWAAVLSPLWITDAVFIVIKSKELRKILRTTVHIPSETYALFPPLGGIIDHLGVAAAKVTLVYRLEGKVDWSLLLLFTPMWTCVVLAGTLRCITPPHPQVMSDQAYFHRAGSFFTGLFHLVARGAQPMLIVLKVDGQVEGAWSSVFIPLWMFMGAIALGGSALCCCAPMVSRGVIPEIRPLLIRGMLLCSVGTFSLTFCALLFLVFLTLELDNNEDFSPRTILAPLIALYALILVFLPVLLLATRHYVRTMHTAEEQFRQANDPNGGGVADTETGGGGGVGLGAAGESSSAVPGAGEGGTGGAGGRRRNRGGVMGPTILMRESSTLFRRASVSLCRRLGETDGSLLDPEVGAFELADWSRRSSASRSRDSDGDVDGHGDGEGCVGRGQGGERVPQRSSRSFHGLQDFLPHARGVMSRGGQRFTAVVTGNSNREGRERFSMSMPGGRQRAGAEKEGSPRQRGLEGNEPVSKGSPEDDRHDRCLLPGDSGTHSVTDSYDLNSYGSYVDSDEENHEVGLSIDGDEDDEDRDGALESTSRHPPLPPTVTPPPEILLGFGSAHGAAAFSLHGGGGGNGSGHGKAAALAVGGGLGISRHRWSAERNTGRLRGPGGSLHGGGAGGMQRRLSWPGGMSSSAGVGEGLEGSGPGPRAPCYICCERRADAVVMECGHGGLCFTCATHVANTANQCPVCRDPIQEILKLHEVREFGRVVAVPNGSGVGGGGDADGTSAARGDPGLSFGELLEAQDGPRPAPPSVEMGVGPLGATASDAAGPGAASASVPAASPLNPPLPGDGAAGAAAAAVAPPTRVGAFRRFSGPDVVDTSPGVAVAGQRGGDVVGGQRAVVPPAVARRESPPPAAARETGPGRRNSLEARIMCEEAGWLDPV